MSILANSNAQGSSNNAITNSLRFQSASSQYLRRTPSTAGNRKTWTWSAWVKLGAIGSGTLFSAGTGYTDGSIRTMLVYSGGALYVYNSNLNNLGFNTTAVYRDPSAWYHVVWVMDTTQATASERTAIYINGIRQTGSTVTLTQNLDTWVNYTNAHTIGSVSYTTSGFFDGYMTEINFIDGQALTPSSFGATDPITGQWVATGYSGSYGTNGFYLPFRDGTSTATLGVDYSGNKNNWNLTNFTRSAGVSDCWMYDVPTNNTGPGLGAFQPASNYWTINPLDVNNGSISQANLRVNGGTQTAGNVSSQELPTSGKWYLECYVAATGGETSMGLRQSQTPNVTNGAGNYLVGTASGDIGYYQNGSKYVSGVGSAYGASYTSGDTIGFAYDADNNQITFYKNGTSQGAITGATNKPYKVCLEYRTAGGTNDLYLNFGQRAFAYTPPTGYKALCTANLPQATILRGNKYMDATLFTGSVSGGTVTNAGGFQPDLVWRKTRDVSQNNGLYDSVRGGTKELVSNSAAIEGTNAGLITSFNSNGFTYGNAFASANSYVTWQWKASGSYTYNTSGTIGCNLNANPAVGFSIAVFNGNAVAGSTVAHGLGVAPKMVIYKSTTNANDWWTYHAGLTSAAYAIQLNTANAQNNTVNFFNSTAPNANFNTLGYWNNPTGFNLNGAQYVAYSFAEIAGFSKFGSYTGNGSTDGPFVYCGFRPKFVMVKIYSGTTGDWAIFDTSRSTYNEEKLVLWPDLSIAESTGSDGIDGLANGFKIRSASNYINGSSSYSYIYMAFAESPFNISNAR